MTLGAHLPVETGISTPADGESLRVLVVDDEPQVREALARVLVRHGLVVDTAENGLAAMAAIGRRQFQAIVCDIRMEFMDGLKLFEELQVEHPDQAGHLVFVTAWANDPKVRDAIERTGRPVLPKPFDIRALVGLVRHLAEDRPDRPGSFARFSPSEARQIRERTLSGGGRLGCPCCGGDLAVTPVTGTGDPPAVWEFRCRTCGRSLITPAAPVAGHGQPYRRPPSA